MEIVHKIDFAVIVFSVLALTFLVGYTRPLVIGPVDNYETTETEILFSIERADYVLIDDNLNFTSPEEYNVEDGMKIVLEPGTYYWKIIGIGTSEVRKLTIKSLVDLRLREGESEYYVLNAGNIKLNVDVFDKGEFKERRKVSVGEEIATNANKFVGEAA